MTSRESYRRSRAWLAIVMGVSTGIGLLVARASAPGADALLFWSLVCFGCAAIGVISLFIASKAKAQKPNGVSGWAVIGIGLFSFAMTAAALAFDFYFSVSFLLFGVGAGLLLIVVGVVALVKKERISDD